MQLSKLAARYDRLMALMTQAFLIALQFLTRLPVRLSVLPSDRALGFSLLFYPVVGLLIGSILVALGWLLHDTPPLVAAALLGAVWVILTGGLHLDGLADSADAWMGGMGNVEKTLSIMKDPNCGAAGVTAISLLIFLKIAVLHSLLLAQEWVTLIFAAVLARTLIPLLFLTTPYVRSQGLGTSLAAHQPRKLNWTVIIVLPIVMLSITGLHYFWLPLAAVGVFVSLRWIMMQRIQGMTGDTAGALVELSELGIIMAAVLWVI